MLEDQSHLGGSYVIGVQFVQDLERFGKLSEEDQETVIGRKKTGAPLDPVPPQSHVAHMQQSYKDHPPQLYRQVNIY